MQLLVVDAYPKEGRDALAAVGGTLAGELYQALLERLHPGVRTRIVHPADGPIDLPSGVTLSQFVGVVWTGSSLTIHHGEDPRVRNQIELGRAIRKQGIRSFGSCWAAQLANVVAGGRCAANTRGREFGVSRQIELSDEGRTHPMYAGKPQRFDALTSHADHIEALGAQSRCLAINDWSPVQALSVTEPPDHFWAVQYHPEYDLREVACLAKLRKQELVDQGTFSDTESADAFVADAEALHRDPSRMDLREKLRVDETVLDPEIRTREVRNWLTSLDPESHTQ